MMRGLGEGTLAVVVTTLLIACVSPCNTAIAGGLRCHRSSAAAGLPSWATKRRMTVIVDSVLLSAWPGIRAVMPCWHMHRYGRPALMLRAAERQLRARRPHVSRLAVVGLGYNSLWERDGKRYGYWAARFDREARKLLGTLRRLGARQVIWVTLREPTQGTVPPAGRAELRQYAWYFPYVNARLRALDQSRDDLALADWTAASNRSGVTYDSIHVNHRGAILMGRTIKSAIRDEAKRQAREPGGRMGTSLNRRSLRPLGFRLVPDAALTPRLTLGGWAARG